MPPLKVKYKNLPELKNRILTISGSLPGVGKSYSLRCIYNQLKLKGYNVKIGAVSKRASTISGNTVASLFKTYDYIYEPDYNNPDDRTKDKKILHWCSPRLHESTKCIFIIDEAYLLSEEQWKKITNAYPKSIFILAGDSAQFDPVDGFQSIQINSISLEHCFRQNDNEFIDFIKKLKNYEIDLNYIENHCLTKNPELKYIDTCYTIRNENNFVSEAEILLSEKYHDVIYTTDGRKTYYKLSTNEKVEFDDYSRQLNSIHIHLLQGLTLPETLGLKINIDEFFYKSESLEISFQLFLKYLHVAFTRAKNISQIYISENSFKKLKHIVNIFNEKKKTRNIKYNFPMNYIKTDSDYLSSITSDELFELFNEYGINYKLDDNQFIPDNKEYEYACNARFYNRTKQQKRMTYAEHCPINPLIRKEWLYANAINDSKECESHHFYCFEIDCPKEIKNTLQEQAYMEMIKKKYVDPYKNYFFCVVYSGHNSFHCFFYNHEELDEINYKRLWDYINEKIFDGLCDKSKRSYNASLCRAPFVKRYSAGKKQNLTYFSGNMYNITKDDMDKEVPMTYHKSIVIDTVDFTDNERDSIEKELDFIRNSNWKITKEDGTGRWRTLVSIVNQTSLWKYRILSDQALKKVYWRIGKDMNLTDQRILSAIRHMNHKKVEYHSEWSESIKKRQAFNKSNDKLIMTICDFIYIASNNLQMTMEAMFILYEYFGRKSAVLDINPNLSILTLKQKNYLKYNSDFDISSTNDANLINILTKDNSYTCCPFKFIKDYEGYQFNQIIYSLTKSQIRKVMLNNSKILNCTDKMNKVKINTVTLRNKQILKDYQSGLSPKDIMIKYSISMNTLFRTLKKAI